ncbi:MAG: rRNA maturation RNase YbeY [Chloroflexi bacterium]|nr:rRNA maturation RNase YbeY [Chloroflexota bacterium]MCY4246613.1 rRNA maturation RNase YbeY [Chloroflexota bacterium]
MSGCVLLRLDQQLAIDETRLIRAAHIVLEQHDKAGCLSIVIQDSVAVAALNRQHRSLDSPTDVLAFPAASLPKEIAAESHYLGDIVIALDYVAARAGSSGTDLADTLCLLIAHATLHLLGYAHKTKTERASMWAAQARALRKLGIDDSLVTQYGGGDA